MKILVLSNEVWNDKINGNNVTTNWFEGMNAKFANIYASPGAPYNKCCKKYFQITDTMMLKSIITGVKAGKSFELNGGEAETWTSIAESEPQKLYHFLKVISGSFLRWIREILWLLGKYDIKAIKQFIAEFQPDVVFSERMATCKMLRLEKIVCGLTDAPMFAFTGDDEYSLKQFSISPFFWIDRFMVRKQLRNNVKKYKIYYMLSQEQKEYYEHIFGCECKILQKCGSFTEEYKQHHTNDPIKMVYAGKFYCNRWKVLVKIANVIKSINRDKIKIVLEIYTKDTPTKHQRKILDDGINTFIKGSVSQETLEKIYRQSDIALHVESKDLKNRLLTRYSFSTKIIDCIFSGCAVMAYCWNQQSGWTYLKREKAGICVSTEKELYEILRKIVEDKSIIEAYSQRAYVCGQKKHNKRVVQKMLLNDFYR